MKKFKHENKPDCFGEYQPSDVDCRLCWCRDECENEYSIRRDDNREEL